MFQLLAEKDCIALILGYLKKKRQMISTNHASQG